MKKTTLSFAITLFSIVAFAQGPVVHTSVPQLRPEQNKAIKIKPGYFTGDEIVPVNQTTTRHTEIGKKTTVRGFSETTIGFTYYDLQTNNAISDRLSFNADNGTVSAVWSFAPDATAGYPNRGTGYNYFDGTTWGPAPLSRIESQRTGYPNIGITASGVENVIAHNTTSWVMQHTYRTTVGSTPWIEDLNSLESNAINGNLWSKTAVNGNSIHVISLTTPVSNGGDFYNGIDGAPLYYRSTDGGLTWDKKNVELPGITPDKYLGFTGDAYQIDAYNNTVAIVIGSISTDVILYKSSDNGETWAKTVLLQHPFPLYDDNTITDVNGDGTADSIEVCDGSLAVLVDNNEMVHVCWGDIFVFNDFAGDGVTGYYPGVNSLIYWDESMAAPAAIPNLGALDLDESGSLEFPSDGNGGILIGSYGTRGLASFPSFGIDANNNIYMSYSAGVENSADPDGKALRHTYVTASTDNGQTWAKPLDVVPDISTEGVYGCLSRVTDENVHLIYQRDYCAGISILNFDPCNIGQENEIVYVEVPVGDLMCSIPTGLQVTAVAPSMVSLDWDDVTDAGAYQVRYKMEGGSWQKSASYSSQKKINNLLDNTHYVAQVSTKCINVQDFSSWSKPVRFSTPPLRLSSSEPELSLKVYPNPISDNATIQLNLLQNERVKLWICDLQGRFIKTIADEIYETGSHLLNLSAVDLSEGIYLLQLNVGDDLYISKIVKL